MSNATSDNTLTAPVEQPGARRWWGLIGLGLAQLLITLDIMVVNIALPSAQAELGFDDASRAWILTAYTLAFGSLLLISGRLADRFGRRTMFVIGLIGFALASAIGGSAANFDILVTSRAVQGAFAAMLAPAALALVSTTFPSGAARARAFGIFGAISMAGGATGLIIGGALTELYSWRWTMFIGVIFAIPAVLLALGFIDRDKKAKPVHIDTLSVITVSLGLLGVVYGSTNAGEDGWASPLTDMPLAIGALLLVWFFVRQARIDSPLLPLRIFADRDRAASLIGVLLTMAGLLASIFFSMYFVQAVLDWDAVGTGLAFLPQPAAVALASIVIGPRLNRRFGPKIVIPLALLLACLGALTLTRVGLDTPYATTVLPALILIGLGGGLFFPTANGLATRGIRPDDIGVGSAVVTTSQMVGGTLGVAVLNTVAALSTAGYAASAQIDAADTIAIIHGFVAAFWGAAGIFVLGAIITASMLRRQPRQAS